MKKVLPIGTDDFRKVREDNNFYYVDKTLFIKDFIENRNEVTLITRPRRFGKTLNISMLREFFDITMDSRSIFEGLNIMNTVYADQINTKPVLYFSFKDCNANNEEFLKFKISDALFIEYKRYYELFADFSNKTADYQRYMMIYEMMLKNEISWEFLSIGIVTLENMVTSYFGIKPIVLIDEYDQPIMSSYENKYHHKINDFFAGFYGGALKGQENLSQALMTGIQRVVKESIFSKLNNVMVYTVLDEAYSTYFGLDEKETEKLLEYYGLKLTNEVKNQYDGYLFGSTHIYNPWSILNYANKKVLSPYWINTSTNYLVKEALSEADESFQLKFSKLIMNENVNVSISLETSFIELKNNSTLWGLLINSGYISILERIESEYVTVRIPNGEVKSEFQKIVAERANIQNDDLKEMFNCLLRMEMEGFLEIYKKIVVNCTSYFDAKENAYHMLFLGMCITLQGMYKITSNIESGYGRSDITMESLAKERFHVIVEFKQGENINALKKQALEQIIDKQYYAGLSGKVLCVGIAHDGKRCDIEYELRLMD